MTTLADTKAGDRIRIYVDGSNMLAINPTSSTLEATVVYHSDECTDLGWKDDEQTVKYVDVVADHSTALPGFIKFLNCRGNHCPCEIISSADDCYYSVWCGVNGTWTHIDWNGKEQTSGAPHRLSKEEAEKFRLHCITTKGDDAGYFKYEVRRIDPTTPSIGIPLETNEVYYNVWYKTIGYWTEVRRDGDKQDRNNPKRLTKDEATKYLAVANAGAYASEYEVRIIDPSNPKRSLPLPKEEPQAFYNVWLSSPRRSHNVERWTSDGPSDKPQSINDPVKLSLDDAKKFLAEREISSPGAGWSVRMIDPNDPSKSLPLPTHYYNVWCKYNKSWTENQFNGKRNKSSSGGPLELTLKEAESFISPLTNRYDYEVRIIDPSNPKNGLPLPKTAEPKPEPAEKPEPKPEPATMPNISSFRLGDSVNVYIDRRDGSISTTETDQTLPVTIIGKAPDYYVLGRRTSEYLPSNMRRRSGKGKGTYIGTEANYAYSCTVPYHMLVTMTPRTANKPSAMKLGDQIAIYLDANDNVVDFETATSIIGTVFAQYNDRCYVGWKNGESIPANAKTREALANATFIETEYKYTKYVVVQGGAACRVAAEVIEPVINVKPKAETDVATAATEKMIGWNPPGWEPKHGERVLCHMTKNSIEYCLGTYIDGGWVLLDQPIGIACSTYVSNRPRLADGLKSLGLTHDDKCRDCVMTGKPGYELEGIKPLEQRVATNELKHGDRVRLKNREVIGVVLVRKSGKACLISTNSATFCSDDNWRSGSYTEEQELAKSVGLSINHNATNLLTTVHPDDYELIGAPIAVVNEAVPNTETKDVAPIPEPEAINDMEADVKDGSGFGSFIGVVGATVAAIGIDALYKDSNRPTEVIRVSEPPPIDDQIIAEPALQQESAS